MKTSCHCLFYVIFFFLPSKKGCHYFKLQLCVSFSSSFTLFLEVVTFFTSGCYLPYWALKTTVITRVHLQCNWIIYLYVWDNTGFQHCLKTASVQITIGVSIMYQYAVYNTTFQHNTLKLLVFKQNHTNNQLYPEFQVRSSRSSVFDYCSCAGYIDR